MRTRSKHSDYFQDFVEKLFAVDIEKLFDELGCEDCLSQEQL